MPIMPCQICGRDFPAKPYRIAKGGAKYCSQLCYYTAQGWDTSRLTSAVHTCPNDPKCLACYVESDPVQRYREKAVQAERRSYPKRREAQVRRKRIRYETDPAYRANMLEKHQTYYAENRAVLIARQLQRRASSNPGGNRRVYWEMTINLLIERDGPTCWLCSALVDLAEASIDHVIPCYVAPDHSAPNLRLAHWTCNLRRPRTGLRPWNYDGTIT